MSEESDGVSHQRNSSAFSLELRMLADKAVAEELKSTSGNAETKKVYFLQIARQLEIENAPREKISVLGLAVIEERLILSLRKESIPREMCKLAPSTLRWYRRVMSEEGYTDPFYARNTSDDDPEKNPKRITEFENENRSSIECARKLREFSRLFEAFLICNHFESKFKKDYLDEVMTVINAKLDGALEALNNKQKIEKHHQYLLFQYYAVRGADYAASLYRQRIKDFSKLTGKQVKKVLSGTSTKLIKLYEPKNTYEATRNGYSGIVCDHCDSLRTIFHNSPRTLAGMFVGSVPKVWCCSCHRDTKPRPVTLPIRTPKSRSI